jgi:hypothetical protein
MKLKIGINLLLVVSSSVGLALPVKAADAPGRPPDISARDGRHDFDFNVGVWRTHIKRILDPLSDPVSLQSRRASVEPNVHEQQDRRPHAALDRCV